MASFGSARGQIILEVGQAMRSVDQLSGRLRQFGNEGARSTNSLSDSIIRNEQHIKAVGTSMLAVGGAITGGFAMGLNAAGNFEQGMNRVKALSGATGDEFDKLRNQALQLSKTTQYTATEAADAMGFLAMAGFDTNEIYAAMPGTLNLAAAAQMDLGRAADISTNILTAFGMEVSQLDHVVDMLTYTFTNSNTSMEQLGEAFKYVGPVASAAGLEFHEVAAALGMLGDAGIQGSMAGTTLRGAITRLISPTAAVKERLDQFGVSVTDSNGKMLGLSEIMAQFPPVTQDTADAMQNLRAQAEAVGYDMDGALESGKSFEQVLADLQAAGIDTSTMMGDLGADAETVAAIMDIFGLRAGPGMLALLSMGHEGLSQFADEINNAGGTAERVAKTQMEGLKGSLNLLRAAWEGAMISFMDRGPLQLATRAVQMLASAINWVSNLPGPIQSVIVAIAGLSGALLTLGGGFLLLLPRIARTKQALDLLRASQYGAEFTKIGSAIKGMIPTFSGASGGAKSFGQALMGIARAHPVLTGIAAAAGVAAFAYKTNFMGIKDAIDGAVGTAKKLGSAFMDAFRDTGASAQAARDDIADVAEATKVVDGVTVYTAFKTNADGTREEIGDIIESVANADGKTAQVLIDAEDGPYWATIDLATGEIFDAQIEVTAEAGQTFTLFERINNGLEAMKAQAEASGLGFAVPIINGLQKVVGVVGQAWGVISPFVDRFKAQFQSLNMIFNPISAGLIAITRAMSTIDFGPLQGVANAVMAAFEHLGYGIQRIGEGAREVISAIAALWQGNFSDAMQHARNALDLFGEGFGRLSQAASAVGSAVQQGLGLAAQYVEQLGQRFPIIGRSAQSVANLMRSAGKVAATAWGAVAKLLSGDLRGALSKLGDLVGDVGEMMNDAFQAVGDVISDLANIIQSGLAWAFDSLRSRFSSFSNTFDRVQGILSNIVGVVGNLASAFASLMRGDISGFFSKIGDAVLDALQVIANAAILIPTMLWDAFQAIDWGAIKSWIADNARDAINALIDMFRSIDWQGLFEGLKSAVAAIPGMLGDLASVVMAWISSAAGAISWDSLWEGAKNIASKVMSAAGDLAQAVMSWIASHVGGISWDGIWEGAKDIAGKVISVAGNLLSAITSWIASHVPGAESWAKLWQNAKDVVGTIVEGFGNLLTAIGSWIASHIPGKGVWSVLWQHAANIVSEIVEGFGNLLSAIGSWVASHIPGKGVWTMLWQNAANIVSDLVSGFGDLLKAIKDWISGNVPSLDDILGALGDFGSNIASAVMEKVDAAWDTLKSWATGLWDKLFGWLGGGGDEVEGVPQEAADAIEGASGSVVVSMSGLAEKITTALGTALGEADTTEIERGVAVLIGKAADYFEAGHLDMAAQQVGEKFAEQFSTYAEGTSGQTIGSALVSMFDNAAGWVPQGNLSGAAQDIGETFAESFKSYAGGTSGASIGDGISTMFEQAGGHVSEGDFATVSQDIGETFAESFKSYAGDTSGTAIGEGIGEMFEQASGSIEATAFETVADEIANLLAEAVTTALGEAGESADIGPALETWISNAAQGIGDAGAEGVGLAVARSIDTAVTAGLGGLSGESLAGAISSWIGRAATSIGSAGSEGVGMAVARSLDMAVTSGIGALSGESLSSAISSWVDRAQGIAAAAIDMTTLANGIATDLQSTLDPALSRIVTSFDTFANNIRSTMQGLNRDATSEANKMQQDVSRAFTTMQNNVSRDAANMSRDARTEFQNMAREVANQARNAERDVSTAFSSMSRAVRNSLSDMVSNTRTSMRDLVTSVSNGMSDASSAIRNSASSWPGVISGYSGQMSAAGRSVGAAAGEGVAAGLRSALGSVRAAANEIVAEVDRAMRKAAEVRSPSRMTRRIAEFMGEGVVVGLLNLIRDVARAAKQLALAATPPLSPVTTMLDTSALTRATATFGSLTTTAGAGVVINNTLHVTQQPGESSEAFAERAVELLTTAYMDGGSL